MSRARKPAAVSLAADPGGQGILFIVSAPSGAGKTSLVADLLKRDPAVVVSISHTTRAKRPKEKQGVNYHFVGAQEFGEMVTANAFLEHAEVFGNAYGTSIAAVRAQLQTGSDVVLEIDWQGAAQIRASHPEAVSIFIVPPSQAALRARLNNRAQDDPAVIETRLAEARTDMAHYAEFDYLVINDAFEEAANELHCIVVAERIRCHRQGKRQHSLLEDLLSEP